MEIFSIIGIGLITVCLVAVVKQAKPEFAIFISLAGGTIILLMIVNMLASLFGEIGGITAAAGIDGELFGVLIRIVGIGYLTEFASDICVDAGSSSMSNKIMLAGKITILFLALPILKGIFEIITGLIG